MEMSDFSWQYPEYARPQIYVVTYVNEALALKHNIKNNTNNFKRQKMLMSKNVNVKIGHLIKIQKNKFSKNQKKMLIKEFENQN